MSFQSSSQYELWQSLFLPAADPIIALLNLFKADQNNRSIMVDQGSSADAQCPSSAALLGYGGVAAAVCLSNWGSAVSKSCFG
jgi:hypothetical protein